MRRARFVPLTENEELIFDFAVEIAAEGVRIKAFVAKGERSIARVVIEPTQAGELTGTMVRDAGKAIDRLAEVVPRVVEGQVALSSRSEPIGPRDLWSLDRELQRGLTLAASRHQGIEASDEELAWWARGYIEVASRQGGVMTRLAEITGRDREYVKAKVARAVDRKLLPKGRIGSDGRRTRLAEPKATKKLERIEAETRAETRSRGREEG